MSSNGFTPTQLSAIERSQKGGGGHIGLNDKSYLLE